MLVAKGTQGFIVWVSVQETGCQEVQERISKLKATAPVTVFCSGTTALEDIVEALLDSYMKHSADVRIP